MAEMLSAGIYPVEVDYSQYVRSLPTSTFGIVGVFEKGPIGRATLVTSFAQAQRLFGTYLDATGHYGMLSLKSFFENGGGRAYVVRVTHYTTGLPTAVAATVSVVDRAGSPLPTLKVSAINGGAWGNALSVEVAASAGYPSTGFTLKVKLDGVVVETVADVLIGSANVADADYIERRVNGVSQYVVVQDLLSASVAPTNLPAITANAALVTGNDGLTSLGVSDYIGTSAVGNGLYAFDAVDVSFIAVPGAVDNSTAFGGALNTAMLTYVEARKDCVAILECPVGQTVTQLDEFRNGGGTYSHAAFNSTWGAIYAVWLNVVHPVTSRIVKAPPAGFVAGIYANTDRIANVWDAPAGLQRGVVRGALSAELPLSKGDEDILYNAGVNYFTIQAQSLVLWGQKTAALRASALDRVNVRRLMAHLERSVNASAKFFVFEANNKRTWEAFIRLVSPFLRQIRDAGGLYEFLVVCDETVNPPEAIDANTMNARVLVKPVKAAEFIPIEYAISPTGAELSSI